MNYPLSAVLNHDTSLSGRARATINLPAGSPRCIAASIVLEDGTSFGCDESGVTPKKEPEVSEPPEFLGVVRHKSDGTLCYVLGIETSRPGTLDWVTEYRCTHTGRMDAVELVDHPSIPNTPDLALLLTPRFTYPPELRSPKVWGIAIDEAGRVHVFGDKPRSHATRGLWLSDGGYISNEQELRLLFPTITFPTLSDAGGNWREAKWMNPDYGKGE